jgi:hypothetical protein
MMFIKFERGTFLGAFSRYFDSGLFCAFLTKGVNLGMKWFFHNLGEKDQPSPQEATSVCSG